MRGHWRDVRQVSKVIGGVVDLRVVEVELRVVVVVKVLSSTKVGPEGELRVAPFPNRESVDSKFEWLEPRKERDKLMVGRSSKKVGLAPQSIELWSWTQRILFFNCQFLVRLHEVYANIVG